MYKFMRTSRKVKGDLLDILFIGPQYIIYLVFTIIPFFIALPMIFTDRLNFLDQSVNFIGFNNFSYIFKEPLKSIFIPAVERTAVFVIINYGMVYLLGMTLALMMFEYKSALKKSFFNIIYLPHMISGFGTGMLLLMLFSPDTGSLNLLLMKIGLLQTPINIKDSTITAIALPILVGWRAAGFNMALFLSGLLSVPADTIDASRVDGVNYLQKLRYVYFPQMVPSIIMATIFCMIGSFGIFDEPVGMGGLYGNTNAEYFAVLLFKMGFSGNGGAQTGTLSQAVTMSMVVYMPLLCIAFGLNKLQKKLQY